MLHTLFLGDMVQYGCVLFEWRWIHPLGEWESEWKRKGEKKGEKERWRVSRHLSGQRPAAVRGTSDMKMRAAQPPADLSHRSRPVHPIPHSMKYPSPFSQLFSVRSIVSMPPSLFLRFLPLCSYPSVGSSCLFVPRKTDCLPSATTFTQASTRCDVSRARTQNALLPAYR